MNESSIRDKALALFERIRTRFPELDMEIDRTPQKMIDLLLTIPVQSDLPFEIRASLAGDELHLSAGDGFWGEWFPCDRPSVATAYEEAFVGLLAGTHRIVERRWRDKSMWALLQRQENQKWKTIARWNTLGILPFRKRSLNVLQRRRKAV